MVSPAALTGIEGFPAESAVCDPSCMPDSVGDLANGVKRSELWLNDSGQERPENSLISRSALAELAGVSRAAITQCCRTLLAAARVGLRVDLAHPAAAAYLARHAVTDAARDAALHTHAERFPAGLTRFVRELRARVGEVSAAHREQDPQEQALRDAAAAFARWAALEEARLTSDTPDSAVAKPVFPPGISQKPLAVVAAGVASDTPPYQQRDERTSSGGQA